MKTRYLLTIRYETVPGQTLFMNRVPIGEPVDTRVPICSWEPPIPPPKTDAARKEMRELKDFELFARSDEFWPCIVELLPGTQPAETIMVSKNCGDDDEPPDLHLIFPNGSIGVELTYNSPVAPMAAKVSGKMTAGAALPGASTARSFKNVKRFMEKAQKLGAPPPIELGRELVSSVVFLRRQMRRKNKTGNDILLLVAPMMALWPDDVAAKCAKKLANPEKIRRIFLISQEVCIPI